MSKEELARSTQIAIEKTGTQISYLFGNATEKSLAAAETFNQMGRGAVFAESFRAVGSTTFKAAEDAARADKLCTGACLVATACEVVAGTSALIKYPGAMKVYFVAKGISMGCIRFRDLCRNAEGKLIPCGQ